MGLLEITGELSGSRDPALADRGPRASPLSMTMGVNRSGAPFHEEGARPPVPDRRREGIPDRHARPMISSPRAPPRLYVPRTRCGSEDVPGRDQWHPAPRGRAADRRYCGDPRPARWLQVHMTNVQPPPPELARSAGPSFHPMAPRRAPEFQTAIASAGWNSCFACSQTGHRLMNCATYLQKCARDPLRANRCTACNAVGLCPSDCRRRLYFATSPYPHLELNKDGTSYFIRCGLPMPRWYRPELLVGLARAAAPAVPTPAAREYRTAYAVHSAALPIAAGPALPAPPHPIPAGVPKGTGPTRCIQQLTWTPSVVVVEPGASERIVAMALHTPGPAAPAIGGGDSAPGPQQRLPEPVAPSHLGSASAKGDTEAGSLSATKATNEDGARGSRPPAAMQATSTPGRSVVLGSTRDFSNVMVVRRDAEDTQQRSGSRGGAIEPTPRLPPPDFRPAHTRAVASLDGFRCIVIIDTGAHVSLVSARMLRPGAKYMPWSECDGRVTGVAQQGIAIPGHAVLEVQLGAVRVLTLFVGALGVGFDAILGVDLLYEHDISVNLSQHFLVFEAHDGLIVPLVVHHPRFKHACALTDDGAIPRRMRIGALRLRPHREKNWTLACSRGIPDCGAERPEIGIGRAGTAGDGNS